jgi:hypothetical protein
MRKRLSLFVVSTLTTIMTFTVISSSRAACRTDDIEILQADFRRLSNERILAIGELVNRCTEPTGIILQLTFRDGDRKVVTVEKFQCSPKLKTGDSCPFAINLFVDTRAKSMDAKVIELR